MRNVKNGILKFGLLLTFVLVGMVLNAQIKVHSSTALLPYLDDDNVNVVVVPRTYTITAADIKNNTFGTSRFVFLGNNSTYDVTGVIINFVAEIYTSGFCMSHIQRLGNNHILKNLTMVDLCDDHGAKIDGWVTVLMDVSNYRIEGFHITVKGSYPYGYEDVFGIGGLRDIRCRFLS